MAGGPTVGGGSAGCTIQKCRGGQKMLDSAAVDTHNILVELSVIAPNGNGHSREDITHPLNILKKTGLFYEQSHNVICVEGEWDEISDIIRECYERVQMQSPQGFLRVSI